MMWIYLCTSTWIYLFLSFKDYFILFSARLWTAPELLRMHSPPPEGTQKGDVYSFAIICQEIVYRSGPFWVENMDLTPQGILIKYSIKLALLALRNIFILSITFCNIPYYFTLDVLLILIYCLHFNVAKFERQPNVSLIPFIYSTNLT